MLYVQLVLSVLLLLDSTPLIAAMVFSRMVLAKGRVTTNGKCAPLEKHPMS